MDYSYHFPVVRGVQAGRAYYIAMVPIKMIEKLFPSDEEYVSPEYRAQRKLNESRVPVISKYIVENRQSYVFSALAASIDGEYVFLADENNNDLGVLEVSMDARFLINDGQHRKAALIEALKEDRSLGDETISVVFYEDLGLARSQQMFTDLNKHAVKTSNSISELYDSRDELAVVTRHVISSVPFLNKYTDKERDILGKYSSNLFTLNTFYTANKLIVGNTFSSEQAEKFLISFWSAVVDNMSQWQDLEQREITKSDLRENFIATQGIVIQALGRIGTYFFQNPTEDYRNALKGLEEIDWSRNAKHWLNRAIRLNGRIITNKKAAVLIANYIKQFLGLSLNEVERSVEEQYLNDLNEVVSVLE